MEPIGIERIEYGIAKLCSIIVNFAKSITGGKRAKLTSPYDFMPKWDLEEAIQTRKFKKQSIVEMKQILEAIAIATGKKLKTNKDRK